MQEPEEKVDPVETLDTLFLVMRACCTLALDGQEAAEALGAMPSMEETAKALRGAAAAASRVADLLLHPGGRR